MKETFISKNFRGTSLETIDNANNIIEEYQADGYELTLRQLYYQFVSRDLIPNKDSEYKKLGSVINDARLAGCIDWDAIVDRTRNVQENSHWSSPADIIQSAALSYALDKWEGQSEGCEFWIEKDALIGVIERPCKENDVRYFSCRGYVSQSEMYSAAQRLSNEGRPMTIFHLGDHDPSGVDMTRDIRERLNLLSRGADIEVKRIALNMDQIREYGPPPNPTKITDSRASQYIAEYGYESWELDALEPKVLSQLVQDAVNSIRDPKIWNKVKRKETKEKKKLQEIANNWE